MSRLKGLVAVALIAVSSFAAAASAPEIAKPGLQWFNVAAPVSIESLRGRIVILDFWTEGCINCIHIIPILRGIEDKFPDKVAVIGVHSPKFAEEKNASSVEDAIKRYEIHHPIVHDPSLSIWKDYGVQAWPTLVIIGPDGVVLGQIAGEPDPVKFPEVIAKLVDGAGKNGELKPATLALKLEEEPKGRFLYPGKLKAVPGATPQWVLADSGHNQIVLLDDKGTDVKRFGSGTASLKDGDASAAAFNHPQGLIASDEAIFVADTGNHAIRRIDLKSGAVTTLAGDGKRGTTLSESAQAGKTTSLASPWDLEKKGDKVYFANAGTHQIGVLDLGKNTIARLAGSGAENILTGSPSKAAFAQPSGLSLSKDGDTLYVADAESSSIRAIDLRDDSTKTLVGTGLFDFGKNDGAFSSARLQHPLGVSVDGDQLFVADTYNSRIRTLDLAKKTVSDFDGGKYTCTDPICYPTREPAGIVAANPDRILLVDTGNQRVEEYTPSTKTSRTWAR
jgi:sugar lactone lactonase YvrE